MSDLGKYKCYKYIFLSFNMIKYLFLLIFNFTQRFLLLTQIIV